ncbi:MAG: hypothetical protein WCG84_03600 [Candidatus Moraniibacteriota bacterium]
MLQEKTYQDWSLRLAFALPVLLIVVVAGMVYLPRLWAKPAQYDFVYMRDDVTTRAPGIACPTVWIENGSLVKSDGYTPDRTSNAGCENILYRYDVATGATRRVSFDEASALKYQIGAQSKDGYEVRLSYGNSGPFGGSSGPAVYLSGQGISKQLQLAGIDLSSMYNFHFLGWIEK